MNETQGTPAFTTADVAQFAELICHHLPAGMTPEAAMFVAAHEAKVDADLRFRRFFYGDVAYKRALLGALGGTYDEFRAEAAA